MFNMFLVQEKQPVSPGAKHMSAVATGLNRSGEVCVAAVTRLIAGNDTWKMMENCCGNGGNKAEPWWKLVEIYGRCLAIY
jgi:hypothetical protein